MSHNFNRQSFVSELTASFNRANDAYVARCKSKDKQPQLNKEGMQNDLYRGLKSIMSFSDAQIKNAIAQGVDFESVANGIASAPNVKKALRVVDFIDGLSSQNLGLFKGSAQTALLCFAGIVLGASNRAGLRWFAAGKGDEMSSDYLVTNKARAMRALVGTIGKTTFDTQCSVATSEGGVLPLLGICEPMKGKNAATPGDLNDIPLTESVFAFINKISDNDFEQWAQDVAKVVEQKRAKRA